MSLNYADSSDAVLADIQRLVKQLRYTNFGETNSDINKTISRYIETLNQYTAQTGTFVEAQRKQQLLDFLSQILQTDFGSTAIGKKLNNILKTFEETPAKLRFK